MSLHRIRRASLPFLTALIGSGGTIIGLWSFAAPTSAAQAFGGYMVRILEATATGPSAKAKTGSSPPATRNDDGSSSSDVVAYIYPHGIRNLCQGLSILALTAYWQFSPRLRSSPPARLAVQRCLGIVVTVGALTPVVDAWINYKTAPDGADGEVDRSAARVHVMRTGIWMLGGLWCLLG